MCTAFDYAERAAECRRLATQYTKPADWGHFTEMAQTWEMLLKQQQARLKQQEALKQLEELKRQQELKHQQEKSRLQTIALADRFRGVLFLSEIEPKRQAETNNNEKAA